ncbi:DUF805 domain-containing protein [Mesorhizobium sp. L-8-10]|uniref:DUF805 domain-containing protein n=1 Tax=unclassified Mesorhizobium TaxID=325217 RepID=UPI001926C3C2|nr:MULTISPECIES: DUF805 domain-containing protein [unclassified Mesorhizobium]BCH27923.1 DUF805 domain-containing protein [Mesorhizobium sp. L-8-3]BCH35816.1 DUF805 domain-containing protein [Mesorhizobium sp. L-8-10]
MPDPSQLVWLFFRFPGRVSRAAYFLASLLVVLIQAFLLHRFTLVPPESSEAQLWALAFFIAALMSLWANIALAAKRFHDFGKSGFWGLISLVAGIVLVLILSFIPGDPGANRYGTRPNAAA